MASFLSSLVTAGTSRHPSIILVHGAWQQASCWGKVTQELHKVEYENVVAVDLPSVGHVVGRDADVAVVRSAVEKELCAGRDVLVVGHSYGGIVISEAVQHFKNCSSQLSTVASRAAESAASYFNRKPRPGRVLGLVYLAGYLPTISDVENPISKPDIRTILPRYVRFNENKVYPDGDLQNNPPEKVFFNDLPLHEAEFWVKQLQFSSYAAMNSTSTFIPYTGAFKCTYVLCEEDNALSAAWSQHYLFQPGAQFGTKKINSGHFVMLSKPKEVADIICRATYARSI